MRGWLPPAAAALLMAARGAECAEWRRLASPHFEMFTDAGERGAVKVMERLESVRHVFLESIGGKAPKTPVRVYLFGSERDFRRLEPRIAVGGFNQGGPDRDYIVLFGTGEETQRAARHEYIHVLLGHTSAAMPLWLEEGTAELYSTVELNAAGALVGIPVLAHVRALDRLEWIGTETFAAASRKAPLLDDVDHAGLYYAQAWALAHMLNFAPAWRKGMPRFAELLDQGTPGALAFEPAFGAPFARAMEELRVYVRQGRFPAAPIAIATRPPDASSVTSEALDRNRAALAQAELLIALDRKDDAAALLASLGGQAASAEVETALGLAALADRRTDEARRRFEAAIAKRAQSAVPYFELAMLMREAGAAAEEVTRRLSEAVGRDPNLAEAHFILGLTAQKEGRHREAIASFEEATRVLPRQSYFWHARALSHHELGQTELARRAALRAAAAAADRAQLEMAQSVLRLVGSTANPPGVTPRRPATATVNVPDSWRRKTGDAQVEGALEQIDCHGNAARLQIRPSGGGPPVLLWVDKPGEVLLNDASSITFTFACGPQKPRKVFVEYQTAQGLPRSARGTVTAIRFLNSEKP